LTATEQAKTGAEVGELRLVPGPRSEELIERARRSEVQASIYPVFFGAMVYAPAMSSQEGVYLEDVDRNRYLDAIGGMAVAIQGFRPQHLIDAAQEQLASLHFLPEMLSKARVELAEELLRIVPGTLKEGKVQFEVSGSSANEVALEIAFTYLRSVGRRATKVLSFAGSYHGRLLGTTAVSGITTYRSRFPATVGHVTAPYPYAYRCPLGADEAGCEEACLAALERTFADAVDPTTGECEIGVAISEPFQSHVTRIPPLGFYRRLRELCDEYDVVFIDDEVVGFGHTGRWFATEHSGVVPDMITMGKSLSGGMFPISAVVSRAEIAAAWEREPDMHLTTYMGHPVGCAAAVANLRSLADRGLIAAGEALGDYMVEKLRELQNRHPLIGFVDGWGLWIEAELVRDRDTKEPALEEAIALQQECVRRGLIVDRSYQRAALYFIPALTITREEIDLVIQILDESLTAVEGARSAP
jgi:4-aminobutyrate aminotransferase / (S)-3-amino-2-methylpropionate transaminase / 5-aminovalerate transaminase